MSEQINDGGPAFPVSTLHGPRGEVFSGCIGMSLRDWFAGKSDIPWNAVVDALATKHPERNGTFTVLEVVAYRSAIRYLESDAMLAERAKGTSK